MDGGSAMKKLEKLQTLPLDDKIKNTKFLIDQWYQYWNGLVYVSFSGGKDSTVLLDIARKVLPDIKACFCNTGLEFPEINRFVRTFDNVDIVKPTSPFHLVLKKYGYPVVSKEVAKNLHEYRTTKSAKLKHRSIYGDQNGNYGLSLKWRHLVDAPFKISHKCCDALKKRPFKKYEKKTQRKAIVGTMVDNSTSRRLAYRKRGQCNAFAGSRPMSTPLSFWTTEDVWRYIKIKTLKISEVYDQGYSQTGCMFCMFGMENDTNPNRFHKMENSHPRHYDLCVNKLGFDKVLDFMGYDYRHPQLDLFRS